MLSCIKVQRSEGILQRAWRIIKRKDVSVSVFRVRGSKRTCSCRWYVSVYVGARFIAPKKAEVNIRYSEIDLAIHAAFNLILSSSPFRGGLRWGLIKLFQDPPPAPPPKRGRKR